VYSQQNHLIVVSALDEASVDGGLSHKVLRRIAAANGHREHPRNVFRLNGVRDSHPLESNLENIVANRWDKTNKT